MTYPYQTIRVAGTEALKTLAELRSKAQGIPVILGDRESFERMAECEEINDESTPQELIEQARQIDVEHWLAERAAEDADYYGIEPAAWPEDEQPPNTTITAHCDVL